MCPWDTDDPANIKFAYSHSCRHVGWSDVTMNAPGIVIVGAHQRVSLGPDQTQYFVGPDLGPAIYKVFSRRQMLLLAGKVKAAQSVTFDLLLLELMFLFFKNTVKN